MPPPPAYTRAHSLLVMLMNAFAVLTPIAAEPLDCPGGYQLEFIWDQISQVPFPSTRPEFLLVTFSCGVVALLVHTVRLVRLTWTPLWLLLAAFLLHLLGRTLLLDWGLLYRYRPWHFPDHWRNLAFAGGAASLLSMLVQGHLLFCLSRRSG